MNGSELPKSTLKPEVVANHNKHLNMIRDDIEGYGKVGCRDVRLFNWLLWVFENVGLPIVDNKYTTSLVLLKTRFTIFEVLIDDVVDNNEKRDLRLLEELLKIPFYSEYINTERLNNKQLKYLNYARLIWSKIKNEFLSYPKYQKYKEALDFDINQMLNAMRYSRFVNTTPNAANFVENKVYVPHGMLILIQSDFDLMCSTKFDDREFGELREIVYLSQRLAKIGNLIATYPRELLEQDMSSEAVIRFTKEYGSDFKFKLNKLLNKESRYPKFEKEIIKEWKEQYDTVKSLTTKVKSIDMSKFMQEYEFLQAVYEKRSY